MVISLPDKVLDESLHNNVLTDLGITMFIRVDRQIRARVAYGTFLMFGLHDYGHFNDIRSFRRFARFYAPYFFPAIWRVRDRLFGSPADQSRRPIPLEPGARITTTRTSAASL